MVFHYFSSWNDFVERIYLYALMKRLTALMADSNVLMLSYDFS